MTRAILYALQGRSWRWAALRDATIKASPECACCVGKKRLTVHHIVPVHVDRTRELEPSNLIVLCRRCHFFVAHFYDWKSFNPYVVEDAKRWRMRVNLK